MYGAILGDIIGSPYEFDMGNKSKDFPLFSVISCFTDDTVMTEIKSYIESEFHYDLSRTCDEIRPNYHHVESRQQTVPEAITAFLEGNSFEDMIRTAVSLGGDCDTLTCIAGAIAEGYYGVPEELKQACRDRLGADLKSVLSAFDLVCR